MANCFGAYFAQMGKKECHRIFLGDYEAYEFQKAVLGEITVHRFAAFVKIGGFLTWFYFFANQIFPFIMDGPISWRIVQMHVGVATGSYLFFYPVASSLAYFLLKLYCSWLTKRIFPVYNKEIEDVAFKPNQINGIRKFKTPIQIRVAQRQTANEVEDVNLASVEDDSFV